ncbi:MAG TPA: chromosome segregation protein SMC [Methylococcaceae bacterium]|nr:chromosome segregation protein SMC [Methylococcaceae bacterium]
MRLEKIRLAGFKSFVDATTVPLPGNLVGIVGPNGCGKSNLIDAVRWVMGESSARHLRGESMSDVIFNGSSSRKPVALASVELEFDNSRGRAPGEYAQYAQIAIKRQVTRDGQSQYFLNGARCRRRDVTDIFLGTGLGPRSYAIIEQGTISRLVEARPEELRGFVEEAAGVSKYKERRHETEIRMRHTRENLERLEDLRDEVAKQIQHLQRQAKKAERHAALQEQALRLRRELLALRWKEHEQACGGQDAVVHELEARLASLVRESALLEEQRETHQAAAQSRHRELQERQAEHYQSTAELGQREQAVRHAGQSRSELEQTLQRIRAELDETRRSLQQDRQRRQALDEEKAHLEQAIGQAGERERDTARELDDARRLQGESRSELERARTESARSREQAEAWRQALKRLEEENARLAARRQRLATERDALQAALDDTELHELEERVAEAELRRNVTQADLDAAQQVLPELRAGARRHQENLHALRGELQKLEGQIASLERLQKHAMGKDRQAFNAWLTRTGLDGAPRLAEKLETQPGWETALERLLGDRLEAVCLDAFPARLDLPTNETLALFLARDAGASPPPPEDSLLARVDCPWDLRPLLAGVRCAASLTEALQRLPELAPGESLLTQDGDWLGNGWLLARRGDAGHIGVLQREKELRALRQRQDDLAEERHAAEAARDAAEHAAREMEQRRDEWQKVVRALDADLHRALSERNARRARLDQARQRFDQLQKELAEAAQDAERIGEERAETEQKIRHAALDLERRHADLAELEAHDDRLRQRRDAAERDARDARDAHQALKGRLATAVSSLDLTGKHLDRLLQQEEQGAARLGDAETRLAATEAPLEAGQRELDMLRENRRALETVLAECRRAVADDERETRRLAGEHTRLEQDRQRLRSDLEQARVDRQAALVRRQTLREQLAELEAEPEAILPELAEDAAEKVWRERLDTVQDDIQKLGAINLAAIDEHREQSERLEFLDSQRADLGESLATLEEAIRKIDRECRGRFKDTFDRINGGLERMFPKLFGGGSARLELTESDPLSAGVGLMARPPGKRNSSIHLLSGGEKALTAVALVFSIFELNPAPFCLLDEVDAPLDEANVGRFSALVREMAEAVQFIFITHNKVTMEAADHLAGVTMKEPGVSRIVAVDIDKAVELATA